MCNSNGYGCIKHLSGRRRRPFVFVVTDAGRQRPVEYFTNLVDAQIFQADYHRTHHHRFLPGHKITLAELYHRWLPRHSEDTQPSHQRWTATAMRTSIYLRFMGCPLKTCAMPIISESLTTCAVTGYLTAASKRFGLLFLCCLNTQTKSSWLQPTTRR